MERIRYETLIARLIDAVPEFPADPGDVKDNLVYLVFNDLTRFLISLLDTGLNEELIQRIFKFIEQAARVQDTQITDVLSDSLNELAIKEPDRAKSYMGKVTRTIFYKVEDAVYGSPSVKQKISRAIKSVRERQ